MPKNSIFYNGNFDREKISKKDEYDYKIYVDRKNIKYFKFAKFYKNIFIAITVIGVLSVALKNTFETTGYNLVYILFIEIILSMFFLGLQTRQFGKFKEYY